MSISENVGALSNHFARVLSGRVYAHLREGGKKVLRQMPTVWELARRSEEHLKGMVLPGTLFEEMGFNYIGPMDGHDVKALVQHAAQPARNCTARSSCTWSRARARATRPPKPTRSSGTGPGPFDPASGTIFKEKATGPSYSQVFGEWLCDMAARDPRIVGITPAMREGSGLVEFSKRFPERYFDVAIAEQHAVTFAAGLAAEGLKPVVAIYSTFLQRAYDQLIHDVALQNLPVVFALDRAGLVGSDGATHQGSYDLSYRALHSQHGDHGAGGRERVPADAVHRHHPGRVRRSVRYPRGTGPGVPIVARDERAAARQGAAAARGQERARAAGVRRAGRAGAADRRARSMPRWSTCASSSRWTRTLLLALAAAPPRAGDHRGERGRRAAPARRSGSCWPPKGCRCRCCSSASPTASSSTARASSCLAAAGLDAAGLTASIERWWACAHRSGSAPPAAVDGRATPCPERRSGAPPKEGFRARSRRVDMRFRRPRALPAGSLK